MFYHEHGFAHIHKKAQGALWAAIFFNVVFVAAEFVFGLKSNSLALMSDAGHNLGDVTGLLVAALALWAAQAQPNKNYTYGFQSLTIVAALINSLILIFVVAEIFQDVVERFFHPQATDGMIVIWVALGSLLAKGLSAWALHHGNTHAGHRHDIGVRSAYLHMLADALSALSVLAAGAIIAVTGWQLVDPLIGLLIGLLIVRSSWRVWHGALRLSLHGVPLHVDPENIQLFLKSQPGVARIHDLHIWALSAQHTALSVHLVYPAGHPGSAVISQISKDLAAYGIDHVTIQVEVADAHCELDSPASQAELCYKKEDCPECK